MVQFWAHWVREAFFWFVKSAEILTGSMTTSSQEWICINPVSYTTLQEDLHALTYPVRQ